MMTDRLWLDKAEKLMAQDLLLFLKKSILDIGVWQGNGLPEKLFSVTSRCSFRMDGLAKTCGAYCVGYTARGTNVRARTPRSDCWAPAWPKEIRHWSRLSVWAGFRRSSANFKTRRCLEMKWDEKNHGRIPFKTVCQNSHCLSCFLQTKRTTTVNRTALKETQAKAKVTSGS